MQLENSIGAGLDNEIYYNMLKWFNRNYPKQMDRFIESISYNQRIGKTWLIEELDKLEIPRDDDGKFKIEIVGGWFGFPLVDLLIEKYGDDIRGIDYFDPDPFASQVFSVYLSLWNQDLKMVRTFSNGSGCEGDYFKYKEKRRAHLIINTSCEHMPDMKQSKKYYFDSDRTLLVLQSNNKTDEEDHINCVNSCEELGEQAECRILGGGHKSMKTREQHGSAWTYYNRFMVLGRWE